jgi:hypothetical protein
MLSVEKQLERVRHMEQALDFIVPALRDAGRIEISLNPAADGPNAEQISLHMHQPAERSDGAALADLLGWTETGRLVTETHVHYRWYGAVGGFRARLVVLVPVAAGAEVRLPVSVGVEQAAPQFADRPSDAEMPPAPKPFQFVEKDIEIRS